LIGAAVAVTVLAGVITNPQAAHAATAGGDGLTITVVNGTVVNNRKTVGDDSIWVFLQGEVQQPDKSWQVKTLAPPMKLSQRSSIKVPRLDSGRVYVAFGDPAKPDVPPLAPPPSAAPSPDTSPVRFDSVELTYPGQGNLTAVDMFGIPLDIATFDAAGKPVGTPKKWGCYTETLTSALNSKLTAAGGNYQKAVRSLTPAGVAHSGSDGKFLRLVSPNIFSGLNPSGYPDLSPYVKSVASTPLRIKGKFDGNAGHPAKVFDYTGQFTGTSPTDLGTLVLTDSGPDKLQSITITGSSLVPAGADAGGIYSNNSPYFLGGNMSVPHLVGENDEYAAAFRDVVAGFAWGFWNSPGHLNDSSLFNVSSPTWPPFAGSQPHHPYYNVWAASFFPYTLAYGFPFADTFNNAPERRPLTDLPTDGEVRITINPDVSPAGCPGATPAPKPTPSAVSAWGRAAFSGRIGTHYSRVFRVAPGPRRPVILQQWDEASRLWRNATRPVNTDAAGQVRLWVPFMPKARLWRVLAPGTATALAAANVPAKFIGVR
jgi:hypothetical protein